MNTVKPKNIIGRAEKVLFPDLSKEMVHARIDSGARTSAIWGEAQVNDDNQLVVSFFGNEDIKHVFPEYGRQVVASSNGHTEARFTVRLLVVIDNRKVRATFTIANRSTQVYPVLIGRNILRSKFIVDVNLGNVLTIAEKQRIKQLESMLEGSES
jgi:hypothetical protein